MNQKPNSSRMSLWSSYPPLLSSSLLSSPSLSIPINHPIPSQHTPTPHLTNTMHHILIQLLSLAGLATSLASARDLPRARLQARDDGQDSGGLNPDPVPCTTDRDCQWGPDQPAGQRGCRLGPKDEMQEIMINIVDGACVNKQCQCPLTTDQVGVCCCCECSSLAILTSGPLTRVVASDAVLLRVRRQFGRQCRGGQDGYVCMVERAARPLANSRSAGCLFHTPDGQPSPQCEVVCNNTPAPGQNNTCDPIAGGGFVPRTDGEPQALFTDSKPCPGYTH
jgi:hypothetical protein